MKQLAELTNEEVRYLCGQLYLPAVRTYFQKNPNKFSEIRRGFRPEKLSDADTVSILVKNVGKPFISGFLVKQVTDWMNQIEKHKESLESEGLSAGEALLKTIPDSVFCDNCGLYFKLSGMDADEQYINLFKDALSLIRKTKEAEEQEETDTDSESNVIEDATARIKSLEIEIEEKEKAGELIRQSLLSAEETLEKYQAEIKEVSEKLSKAETAIAEMQSELNHYRYLDNYADNKFEDTKQYQHLSVGLISHDSIGQTWINRLADIVDGEIQNFYPDEYSPKYYDNRDRLFWKDGPDKEGEFGIWGWSATPRDTDPFKDYVTSEYQRNTWLTEVVEIPQCHTISELVKMLTEEFERNFTFEKILFVCTTVNGTKEGLLCSSGDFETHGNQVRLSPSVFTLPKYVINLLDLITIAGKRICRNMNLGIPQGIVRVREPYEVVKKMVLSRSSVSVLREQGLSKKEAQHCINFLKELPMETLIQELSDTYACTESEAKGYVEGFVSHADTYLLEEDIDTKVLSAALSRNPDLVQKCKEQLTKEWEEEVTDRMIQASEELRSVKKTTDEYREKIEGLLLKKREVEQVLEEINNQIAEKEQLVSDVENKIAQRIEDAKKDAADFISQMAFTSPVSSTVVKVDSLKHSLSSQISYVQGKYKDGGEIDDIDTFEEELAENLIRSGYEEKISVEMGQIISFCICNRMPIIVEENAGIIATCISGVMGGKEVAELFIPISDIEYVDVVDAIFGKREAFNGVFLLHGVFDGYSNGLFNMIVSRMQKWDDKVCVILSIQGISPRLLPMGGWNHSFFIDGDNGLQCVRNEELFSYKLSIPFELSYDKREFMEKMKAFRPYKEMLSNISKYHYASFLTSYGLTISGSWAIQMQMITVAKSAGVEDRLREMFYENGVTEDDEMPYYTMKS